MLGAGGAIGIELVKALKLYTKEIKLVNRNPKKITENDMVFPADLLNANDVNEALKNSEVAYLTAGLK
ncbi:MAG: NAD(P)H-binding protein [Ignavibacteriae bacterium]|nr:NAD(P)H-binding protein [Ignavibacteriota bacterium]